MAFQIGYKNLLNDDNTATNVTITASSEATGYEKENAYDGLGYDWWKPTATGQSWLKANFLALPTVDYMAIWGHNLGDATCSVRPQYSTDDIAWTDADTQINKTDNNTVYFTFTPVSAKKYWRVLIDTDPNKLLWSEDFLNAAWTQSLYNGGALDYWTVTSNNRSDPDGMLTAETFVATATPAALFARQNVSFSGAHAPSIYIFIPTGQGVTDVEFTCEFEGVEITNTQTVTTFGAWVRIDTLTATAAASRAYIDFKIRPDGGVPAAGFTFSAVMAQLEEGVNVAEYIKKTTATTTIPAIAGIQIGETLEMPHGAEVGFAVPTIAPKVELKTAMSESGAFIGGSQLSQGVEGSFSFTNIDPAWVRANWEPFVAHAQKPETFVISWDTVTYTTEIMHAWADGQIPAPNYSSPLYMNFSLQFKGNK